jgi:hypothetical protein
VRTQRRSRLRRVDVINTFRLSAGHFAFAFALFRVVSRCFASSNLTFPLFKPVFVAGSIPTSSTEKKHFRDLTPGLFLFSSWLRSGAHKVGSTCVQVPSRLEGKQTSTSFEDMASAAKFQNWHA